MTTPMLDGYIAHPPEFIKRYKSDGLWTDDNLSDFLDKVAKHYSEAVAAQDEQRNITFKELRINARKVAAYLCSLGVEPGERVVLQLPGIVEYLEVFFGVVYAGAIPVLVLPSQGEEDVAAFIEKSGATIYVTLDRYGATDFEELASNLTIRTGVTPVVFTWNGEHPWNQFSAMRLESSPAEAENVALFLLSGGTTGRPKLIPRTHADYLYSVRECVKVCDVRKDDVMLIVLPVTHNFPMSAPGVLGALYAGARILFSPNTSAETTLRMIDEQRVTQVALVPALTINLLNVQLEANRDLSSLRTVWVGGAKLSESVAQRVSPELGCQLQQVFGMAEGLLNFTRLDDPESVILRTQGRPISPADEVRVVDSSNTILPPGDVGHLQTRGPYTIRGYFQEPEKNAESFTEDGFYVSGDIAHIDESGNVEVVGRAKDQINRGGEKIAPESVENALLGHQAIHDVSAVGVFDQELGEKTRAYIILRDQYRNSPPSGISFRRFLAEKHVSRTMFPDEFVIVDEFPQTGIGKTNKRYQR